jgi:chemotaxis protein MotB
MRRRGWGVVGRLALSALALGPALSGCVVSRATYDMEVERRLALEDLAERRALQIEELERRIGDLEKTGETLELERTALEQERLELIEGLENLRAGNEELRLEVAQERHRRQQESGTYRELVEHLESEVAAGNIEIHRLRGRLQVRALEGILFDSGSPHIKPEGAKVLAKIAREVRAIPDHDVRVEGHTDPVPISTAQFPSNWELSVTRAAGVVRFLIEQGLQPERLSAEGFGPYQPIADNDTASGRARNRRIEIVLVPRTGG